MKISLLGMMAFVLVWTFTVMASLTDQWIIEMKTNDVMVKIYVNIRMEIESILAISEKISFETKTCDECLLVKPK